MLVWDAGARESEMNDRLFHFNINVTDLDRSIAFYSLLGFKVLLRTKLDPETMQSTLSKFDETDNDAEFALIRLGDDLTGTCIDLVKWDKPVVGPARRVNEIGLCRIAIQISDRISLLARLAEANVHLMGGRGALERDPDEMFCFRDPDGVIVEIVAGLDHLVDGSGD
jgi:glyoxylase I family protein